MSLDNTLNIVLLRKYFLDLRMSVERQQEAVWCVWTGDLETVTGRFLPSDLQHSSHWSDLTTRISTLYISATETLRVPSRISFFHQFSIKFT